ncbi:hypothetical protein GGF42_005899 [Coemansia sp. RSA 2424]|nr:hypothetical protein GGF42_005899 [Coemansia sp. RSA 2424]
MSPLNGRERRSLGLGIVLSNNGGAQYSSQAHSGPAGSQQIPNASGDASMSGVYSFFHKLSSGIASFMTTEIDETGDIDGIGGPQKSKHKTQLEDMLESYYLSQGRPVPDWVHCPPPDPPANAEESRDASSVVIDKVPAYTSASSQIGFKDEGDSEAERCSKAKSKHSSSTSGALRSFAKLNISRLARAQFSLGGANSSSTSTGGTAAAYMGTGDGSSRGTTRDIASGRPNNQMHQTMSDTGVGQASRSREILAAQARSAHDSGFNSPMLSPRGGVEAFGPAVDVHIVDSGNTTPGSMRQYSSAATPGAGTSSPSLQTPLDGELSLARRSSGNISPNAKTPSLVKRSLTLDRWRRKDNSSNKNRMGPPISLASLMPGNKDGQMTESRVLNGSRIATPGPSNTASKPIPPLPPLSLGHDTPDSLGLGQPQLTSSKSEPVKPEPSRPARSKFSVRLRHRPESSKQYQETTATQLRPPIDALVGAGEQEQYIGARAGTSSSKHIIPGTGKVKRLFSRRRSSHEQK